VKARLRNKVSAGWISLPLLNVARMRDFPHARDCSVRSISWSSTPMSSGFGDGIPRSEAHLMKE